MKNLLNSALKVTFSVALCSFSTVAMAHDMGSVAIAYALVLAIPIPAIVVLMGLKRALFCFILVAVIALALANSGAYLFMYIVLFSPYVIWVLRAIFRRRKTDRLDV